MRLAGQFKALGSPIWPSAVKGEPLLSIYLFCGQQVESNLAFPGLPVANNGKAQILFSLGRARALTTDRPWSHHWLSPNGERLISYCRVDSYHWLQFADLADCRITDDASHISCYPAPGIPRDVIQSLVLDQVLPRCLAHRGALMLHASAVRLERGLVLFTGDSHAGKSTLAGSFHQAGHPAVSDDVVRIKEGRTRISAFPSYGSLRLWEDSLRMLFDSPRATSERAHYSAKKKLMLGEASRPHLVRGNTILAVIVLSPATQATPGEPSLTPLSQREAYIEIGRQTFLLHVTPETVSRQMETVARIIAKLKLFRMSIPHDYRSLPGVRQMIVDKIV